MSNTHVQPGKVIQVTLAAVATGGALIKVGDLTGVCLIGGAINETISVAIDEVYTVAKKSGDTFAQGAVAYLDPTNKRITSSANDGASPPTAFIVAGKVTEAAGSSATTANLKLNA